MRQHAVTTTKPTRNDAAIDGPATGRECTTRKGLCVIAASDLPSVRCGIFLPDADNSPPVLCAVGVMAERQRPTCARRPDGRVDVVDDADLLVAESSVVDIIPLSFITLLI